MNLLKTIKYMLPLLLLLPALLLNAQEQFDLKRCISTGLENNYSLKLARNQEQIADNNYTRGNAGMLPTVDASGRMGGNLNSINYNYSDETTVNASGIHNTSASASIDLGIPIFRGFQIQHTYRKLGEQKELGGLKTQMSIENLVSQIIAEYNFYTEQIILFNNMAYAVSLSRERVRIDEQRYLLGGASKMQLLQSKVYLNADSSRYARQNEVLRSSQIRLNKLMANENLGLHIVLPDTLIEINKALQFDELLDKTLQNNTSLLIASSNRNISEIDYKIIQSRNYPYLNFGTGYSASINNYNAGDLSSQQSHGINYGLTLGIDLFDGFNRKREQANALIAIDNNQLAYEEIEQAVKAELLTIFYAYENNLRLLLLEEENLAVARENLEIALEQYKLGGLAGLELREVQKSLLDAEERLISVKYLTKVAEISLMQISGQIMEYL
ncbi:TolC family protein [Roseimarinus sediminis]|uniref:TolC family protein n=1 Tax=Roseimarinus sediminis TaxID=1610899 RepID=UPI003D1F67B5